MSIIFQPPGCDLLTSTAEALVDPVNCEGVHGKGLALAFKNRWPHALRTFTEECRRGEISTGAVYNHRLSDTPSRWLLFFPTKDLWREPTRLEYIEKGLEDLIDVVQDLEITSIAIPALGCGLGGLSWQEVQPLITATAAILSMRGCQVSIYPPH